MDLRLEFTDDEIREELARLGYQNVPANKLADFKKDLMTLMHSERSKTNSLNSSINEPGQSISPVFKENSEYSDENFTNHGNQWIDQDYKDKWSYNKNDVPSTSCKFREDWKYKGGDKTTNCDKYNIFREEQDEQRNCRPTTAPPGFDSYTRTIPSSYGHYELPEDVDTRKTNENQSNENECRETTLEEDLAAKPLKRKTCRIIKDGCRRVEESFCESETDGIFEIYEKIKSMAMRDCKCAEKKLTETEEPPYRQNGKKCDIPSFKRLSTGVIRNKEPPHTRNLVKTKPFDRMMYYKKIWKTQPPVHEINRIPLHKMIHAKMTKKDEIVKEHKVYIPNSYVVPTTKPRVALRWKVRAAIQKYEMPEHGFYHEI